MSDSPTAASETPVSIPEGERDIDVPPARHGDGTPDRPTSPALPSGPTTLAKLRGLPWSITANSLHTFYAQFTIFGSVFVLFLDTLGLNKSQIGVLLSLLPFSSVLAPFVAPAIARFGYKRAFLSAYGARKVATAFLLLTPWVTATFGATAALGFVTAIVALFSILRALVEISYMPWVQEYVPNSVRGKYTATDNRYVTLCGIVAISIAGYVVGHTTGLTGYMVLIGAGVLFGFLALWCFSFIPGGAPVQTGGASQRLRRDLRRALHDPDYRRYLWGVSLNTLGITAVASFLPLYLQEQVGIATGAVVWIQIGTLLGVMVSSYLWGWAADRYGSSPVMRSGAILLAVLPLLWWLIPRHVAPSLYFALGIAFLQGIANLGWALGASRLLHVSLVPPERKVGYMALYAAWIGIVAGCSRLGGGWILDSTQGLSAQAAIFVLDPYVPLFLLAALLSLASLPVLHGIRVELSVGVREFAGIFFRGNPFMAVSSLIRIQAAQDERTTVLRTEQLGQSGSRLTVQEVVDALSDPRFQVRYEAVATAARMRHDSRLTEAIIALLSGTELPLSVQAAWALGRMGDPSAIDPLRKAIDNPYRSIQVQSIRSLGALGDTASSPILLERLRRETDKGLQMAYAAALGHLEAQEAREDLLLLLDKTQNPGARIELALALGRLVGKEHLFIRLQRHVRADPGTAVAQTLLDLKRRSGQRRHRELPELRPRIEECTDAFANEDLEQGVTILVQILGQLPYAAFDESPREILQECRARLNQYGPDRVEYLILALHTLNVAWNP